MRLRVRTVYRRHFTCDVLGTDGCSERVVAITASDEAVRDHLVALITADAYSHHRPEPYRPAEWTDAAAATVRPVTGSLSIVGENDAHRFVVNP